MATQHMPEHWIQKVMVLLSIPGAVSGQYDHEIVRFFKAWAQAEGGNAKWDPLNTTDHARDNFGSWEGVDYNTIGVSNFTTQFHGIVLTAATLLENSGFAGIVDSLRKAEADGLSAEQLVEKNASEIKDWGTSPTLMLEVLQDIK